MAFTILSPRLPEDLQGRISVLNSSLSSEEVQKAKEHELRHLLYDRFSQTENRQEWAKLDFPKRLEEIKALKDHRHFAESFKKLTLAILKDEVVAYLYHGAAQIAIQQASGLVWEEVMSRVRNDLLKRKDFSVEEKASIYQIYQSQHADYLRQLGEYQWLVIKLFRLIKEEKEGMTVEKIIALLTNTPLEKSRHLARYFGIKKPGEVPQKYAEARQKLAEGFSEKVKEVIELLDSAEGQKMSEDEKRTAWEKTVELARMARLPVNLSEEALPALLQVIQRSNHEDFVSLSLDTLSLILDLYNFQPTKVSLEEITRVLEQFGQSKTSKENILLNLKTQFLLAKIDISQEISRDFRQPKKQPTRFNLTKLIEAIREEVRRKMAEQREEQVVPKPKERVYDLTALQARMRDKREYISYQEMYEPLNEIFRGLTTLGRPKEKTLHRCTLSPKIIALLQLIRLEESSLPRAEKLKIVRKQLAHHEEQARTDFHRFRDMGRGRATNEAWEETGVWYEAGSLLKRGHLTPAIYALLDKAQRGFADEVFLSHTDDIPLAILRARERFLGMTPLSDENTSQMLSEIGLEREVFPDLKCAALCAQAIGS